MAALDLKYRPRRFSDVLGNAGVRRLLLTRSKAGTLGDQSMMFGGPKGCGKTSLARIVARAILCKELDGGEPCGKCHICSSILDDVSSCVEELDAASQGTVDRVRSMVQEADYGTLDGEDRHIYIIDEAQRLSKAAQDALLKAVEGRFFIVILCTTEPHNIRGPIRDRVEEYPIQPPPVEELVAALVSVCRAESVEADEDALALIVKMNARTPRSCLLSVDALSVAGPVRLESVKTHFRFNSYVLVDQVLSLLDSDPASAFSALDNLSCLEGPTWIRDAVVLAISSGLRSDIGARSTFPVDIHFFPSRGRLWTSLAQNFGRIDRPSMADLEAELLSSSQSCHSTETITKPATTTHTFSLPLPPPPPPLPLPLPLPPKAPEPAPQDQLNKQPRDLAPATSDLNKIISNLERKPIKAVTVDGITFSSEENLTTLDSKIGTRRDKHVPDGNPSIPVGLDVSRAPIPEKEFSSEFLQRFRRSGPR